jgi:ABC-type lipoprotein export system ATPase subunit
LLADEPTGNLDAESGHQVLQLLRGLASSDGRAVVLVTHDAEAAQLADRVLRIDEGRLMG